MKRIQKHFGSLSRSGYLIVAIVSCLSLQACTKGGIAVREVPTTQDPLGRTRVELRDSFEDQQQRSLYTTQGVSWSSTENAWALKPEAQSGSLVSPLFDFGVSDEFPSLFIEGYSWPLDA